MNVKRLREPMKIVGFYMPLRYHKMEERLQQIHGDVSLSQIRRAALELGLQELLRLETANKPNPPLS